MIVHGMFLSVLLVLSYSNGGQTIERATHQFVGPTAIEDCTNAENRLNAAPQSGDGGIISTHASCIAD